MRRQRSDIEEVKLERISKKYQWIALRELVGFLADHYWLEQSWQSDPVDFVGAWQLWAREFDPSQRLVDLDVEDSPNDVETRWQSEYPNPFEDAALCNDREAWVTQHPVDFARLLCVRRNTPDSQYPWCVVAERSCWCSETIAHIAKKELEISAVFWLEDNTIKGGLTKTIIQPLGGR